MSLIKSESEPLILSGDGTDGEAVQIIPVLIPVHPGQGLRSCQLIVDTECYLELNLLKYDIV